jgi:hypothetical protein
VSRPARHVDPFTRNSPQVERYVTPEAHREIVDHRAAADAITASGDRGIEPRRRSSSVCRSVTRMDLRLELVPTPVAAGFADPDDNTWTLRELDRRSPGPTAEP